jgi:hypothetical protein
MRPSPRDAHGVVLRLLLTYTLGNDAGRGIDFVQFRFRRMRLPPLTETAERIAHEWLRPVSNNNVYLTRTELSSPQPQKRPGAEAARPATVPMTRG